VKFKTYIISTANSKRRDFQKNQLKNLNIDYEFIDAETPETISLPSYEKHKYDWQRKLKVTEYACYLSHRNTWSITSEASIPSLILEDDALISNELIKLISHFDFNMNIDYLNIENRGRKKILSRKKSMVVNEIFISKLFHDTTGAASYFLWPNGAKKLLTHESKNGIALADAQIVSCKTLIKYQIEPSLAIQLDMANFYGFKKNKDFNAISKSSVSSKYKEKKSLRFIVKRIKFQILLGLKKIYLIFIYRSCYIDIANKDTFNYQIGQKK